MTIPLTRQTIIGLAVNDSDQDNIQRKMQLKRKFYNSFDTHDICMFIAPTGNFKLFLDHGIETEFVEKGDIVFICKYFFLYITKSKKKLFAQIQLNWVIMKQQHQLIMYNHFMFY